MDTDGYRRRLYRAVRMIESSAVRAGESGDELAYIKLKSKADGILYALDYLSVYEAEY